MDRYFEGDTFSVTEVSAALAMNVQEASIVPVCMGSPINLRGVSNLLDDICGYYEEFLQREYDLPGLTYWAEQKSRGASEAELRRGFEESEELQN